MGWKIIRGTADEENSGRSSTEARERKLQRTERKIFEPDPLWLLDRIDRIPGI